MPSNSDASSDIQRMDKLLDEDNFLEELRVASSIHALLFERLVLNGTRVSLSTSEVLEDIGNKYLRLSEEAQQLCLLQIEGEAEPLVPVPVGSGDAQRISKPRIVRS